VESRFDLPPFGDAESEASQQSQPSPAPPVLSLQEIAAAVEGDVRADEPMSRHTSFGIGGPADCFFRPAGEKDLRWIITWARAAGKPVQVIGNGTNLLVSDNGVHGVVIQLGPGFRQVTAAGDVLIAGAGTKLAALIQSAEQAGLSGLEALVGVPGTLGGAIVTNAGTDVGSISDVVQAVSVMEETGHIFTMHHDDLQYAYRHSSLMNSGLVVLQVRLVLQPADRTQIRAKIERLRIKRATRQPLRARSAGSVFKNPATIAAGKVLDRAGAKGMRCGDAQVSYKHANFIVNRGQATAAQVRTLVEQLEDLVWRLHGIRLEPEIEFVGEW